MSSILIRLAIVCLLALTLAAACGDDDEPAPSGGLVTETTNPNPSVGGPQEQPAPVQELASQATEPTGGVIEVSAADTRFEQNYLRVAAGQPVTIRLTNNDGAPHNIRIAGIDGQYSTEDDAVTSPGQVDPGQTGELTFAPPAPGAYTFQCDFHPTQMGGEVVVGDATPIPAATAEPTEAPTDTPTE